MSVPDPAMEVSFSPDLLTPSMTRMLPMSTLLCLSLVCLSLVYAMGSRYAIILYALLQRSLIFGK